MRASRSSGAALCLVIVVLACLGVVSCAVSASTGYVPEAGGVWAGWGNGLGRVREYLVLSPLGQRFLVLHVWEDGVVRRGVGVRRGDGLLVRFTSGMTWALVWEQEGEVRAYVEKNPQPIRLPAIDGEGEAIEALSGTSFVFHSLKADEDDIEFLPGELVIPSP